MPVLVDVSSPARATAAAGATITTAAFDPPGPSLLVACVNAAATAPTAITVSNNGTPLTWLPQHQRQPGDAGSQLGYAGVFVAQLAAGRTGMTVTATLDDADGSAPSLKVYVLTGAMPGTAQAAIGASVEGSSVAQVTTTTAITTTPGVGNLVVVVGTDADAAGAPTSTDTTEDAFDNGVVVSGMSGFKPVTAASTTCNITTAAAGPALNYAVVEILAEPGTPLETLVTDFDTLPASMTNFNGATLVAGGVEAESIATYAGVETTEFTWSLHQSEVVTQMTAVPDAGNGTVQALMSLQVDAQNQLRIGFQADQLRGTRVITGPSFADVFAVPYDPVNHAWLRISETGGTVTWASSPDGRTWTPQATLPVTVLTAPVTHYQLQLLTGYFGEETPPLGIARWEHLNVGPRVELASRADIAADTFASLTITRRHEATAPAAADLPPVALEVARGLGAVSPAAAGVVAVLLVDTPVDFAGFTPAAASALGVLTVFSPVGLAGVSPAAVVALAELTLLFGPRDVTVTVGPSRLGVLVGANRIDREP